MSEILTKFYFVSAVLVSGAAVLFVLFAWNQFNRFRSNPETREPLRSRKKGRDTVQFLVCLVLFFAGLAVFNYSIFLQTYHIFAEGEAVAVVEIHPDGKEKAFSLTLQPLGDAALAGVGEPLTFILQGDKWMLEGHVIRFADPLYYLGLKPVYQLTRVQGGYFAIEEETTQPRSVQSLIPAPDERWWRWMFQASHRLPFVRLSFGSAVSQSAEEGRYLVKILPTGLTLELER